MSKRSEVVERKGWGEHEMRSRRPSAKQRSTANGGRTVVSQIRKKVEWRESVHWKGWVCLCLCASALEGRWQKVSKRAADDRWGAEAVVTPWPLKCQEESIVAPGFLREHVEDRGAPTAEGRAAGSMVWVSVKPAVLSSLCRCGHSADPVLI